MKLTSIYTPLLLFMLVIGACRKDDDPVFDKTADERINEALSKYQAALIGAPDGWEARIVTGTGGIFNFHFQFKPNNRVSMYADIDTATAGNARESSYRLKALQQPSLIFDTYSYLHQLADPDGNVNGGDDGSGLVSDFEFSIDTVTTDSIKLTGRFNNTKVTLLRAAPQDAAAWQNGDWRNTLSFQYIANIQEYFKRLTFSGAAYDLRFNVLQRTITFVWADAGGTLRQFTSAYFYTREGLILETPFNDGTRTITRLTGAGWNNNTLRVTINGNTPGTIAGAISPIKNDLGAPRRWWETMASQQGYWITGNGFHVNGVDDAFRMRSIPNFYFAIYWPEYNTQDGVTYDVMGYVVVANNSLALQFGSAWEPPTFTANGRVIFRLLGTLGTVPASAVSIYNNINTQMEEPSGYYLVQTSTGSYDMVSAKDARAWITWEQ
ncbi:DUF4302 domain-containing protein [Chitinophaga agrisoli]|uniref:DUF4302 domain-containing protein n=1 Tax=Chitinophaga agrisoli TaxID=2607653 RepID=A0A5B2VHT9_9BACT|nr:DUF4302 domain-containing protein [Chitinophaga agrisoli]KAA2238641.1 DUF4302 domain-containing protein [Chitinophaga agrisoli]